MENLKKKKSYLLFDFVYLSHRTNREKAKGIL